MNNILVTGSTGQLGSDVVKELLKRGYSTLSPNRSEFNLCSEDSIRNYILNSNCEAIVHCAAYTQVDKAEDEKDLCIKINATATKHIVKCAKILDIPMIYISTDYVFDGTKDGEYTENDETNPINIYGESKLAGEKYVQEILDKYYIVRTSWVFNINGKNFIETMLRLSKANNQLSIVNDQIGSPTYTKDLSRLLVDMLETSKYGLYHATNEGYCSWYEFADTIFKLANINIDIKAINSNEYASRAKRPLNSKLSKDKLIEYGFKPLPHWEDALKDYLIRRRDLLI
ncbi:dTDP-4-dehydrorhamnose reductase [Romboutsia timonensis]|jgi:dTDP-4-dehydrorhamnose reductase|uniref:dTDP-4-dehydrorhamnose reductase n=1 Tax=Romboutsia timonensis TaxID=1776391 RepID=UPI0008D8D637|nr:dTDP-4-dehydrorhamnose reductase [Romboutsia timonensis]MCI6667079.1 dTDP-4-dehydrorhamnose reductase [Romboutsia timonensis]MDY2883139.1 dTDP-4-dehydrorhamnose reductase [Romboutsia timonensis]MDY3960668.1 dTDP-4-dehydrorhamnose reductase [Romboutsia timonensis]